MKFVWLWRRPLIAFQCLLLWSQLLFSTTTNAFGLVPDPASITTDITHSLLLTTTATSTVNAMPWGVQLNPAHVYMQALTTWPLYTKMATGATLAVAGDALAQAREVEHPYDRRRATSFAVFDMAYRALQHVTYPMIVAHFHGQYLCGVASLIFAQYYLPLDVAAAFERTLCSQLGIVPFMYYPVFFTLTAALQGLDAAAGWQRAKDMFIPLMQRNLMFWIPVQYVQFSYVPEDLQIPFISVAGLAWTAILSVLAGAAAAKDSLEEETYCVIGNEDECVLPADDLFPHATLDDVADEVAHEWDVVTHEWEEITHVILQDHGEEGDASSSPHQDDESVAQEEAEETTARYR